MSIPELANCPYCGEGRVKRFDVEVIEGTFSTSGGRICISTDCHGFRVFVHIAEPDSGLEPANTDRDDWSGSTPTDAGESLFGHGPD